jgi:Protein of unknown function (DUF1460).
MRIIHKSISFALLLLASIIHISAQQCCEVDATAEDKAIFERYITASKKWESLSSEDVIINTAKFFLGIPYVAATLEKEPERLVINLREMDCTTFVENVLSLSQTVRSNNPTFEAFCNNLRNLRYRDGKVDGYASRIHYTTDWIYVNSRKGLVEDITKSLGGEVLRLKLSFMSTHPDSYKQMKDNPALIEAIAAKEKEINKRSYYYIPESEINAKSSGVKNGDVVCFTTSIEGLDTSHVGIAHWVNGELTFIHASSTKKHVIVNDDNIQAYTEGIRRNSGVMFIRPLLVN